MTKRFFDGVITGAATCVGYFIAKKGIDTVTDPYKKAKIKRKITNVKNAFMAKEES